jgi:hypothetical protein
MLSPLNYSSITYGGLLQARFCNLNPVASWLAFGKLPESPVVTPTSSVQVVRPSAENKFLESVTVEAIPTTPGTGG